MEPHTNLGDRYLAGRQLLAVVGCRVCLATRVFHTGQRNRPPFRETKRPPGPRVATDLCHTDIAAVQLSERFRGMSSGNRKITPLRRHIR